MHDDIILLIRLESLRVPHGGTFLRLDRNRTGTQGKVLSLIYLKEVSC